jgi:hypothetical protein
MRATLVKAAATVIALMLVMLPASAQTAPPEGFEFEPASQKIVMGIGCEGEGLCNSTEYWIGDRPGASNVGSIPGPVTPANEVAYQAQGQALNSQDFPANTWLSGREFHLRTDEPLTGQVTLAGYGNAGFGANTTVDVVIGVRNRTTNRTFTLTASATEHHLPAAGPLVLEYSIDLDPAMDGDVVTFNNLNLVVRGVNVLTGFINGQGESYFTAPTYRLVEVVAP